MMEKVHSRETPVVLLEKGRSFRAFLLATFLLFCAHACWAAPGMVGCPASCNIAYSTVTASPSVALPTSTTAGNSIAVAIRYAGNATVSTCCDGGSNTYTLVASASCTGATSSDGCIGLYRAFNIAGGAVTCQATFSTGSNNQIACGEISGLTTTDPLDQNSYNQSSVATTTPTTNATGTTTQASEYVFAAVTSVGGNITSCTAGAGYTVRGTFSGRLCYEDQTASSTGTFTGTWTTNSTKYAAGVATLKASGGAAAPAGMNKRKKLEQMDPG
jgi:hypothetical protein